MSNYGPNNNAWKGNAVSYRASHSRVASLAGPASLHNCVACGEQAHEWSYDNTDPFEKTDERGRVYSPDPSCYDPMCRKCHRFNDKVFRVVAKQVAEGSEYVGMEYAG